MSENGTEPQLSSYAWYRVTIARSLDVGGRYYVLGEQGEEVFQVAGNPGKWFGPFHLYDAAGSPLAELRLEEAFQFPNMETYELVRGDVSVGKVERRKRRVKLATADGEGLLVSRSRLSRRFSVTRSGVPVGSLRRRRSLWERNYDLQLPRDLDRSPSSLRW